MKHIKTCEEEAEEFIRINQSEIMSYFTLGVEVFHGADVSVLSEVRLTPDRKLHYVEDTRSILDHSLDRRFWVRRLKELTFNAYEVIFTAYSPAHTGKLLRKEIVMREGLEAFLSLLGSDCRVLKITPVQIKRFVPLTPEEMLKYARPETGEEVEVRDAPPS